MWFTNYKVHKISDFVYIDFYDIQTFNIINCLYKKICTGLNVVGSFINLVQRNSHHLLFGATDGRDI